MSEWEKQGRPWLSFLGRAWLGWLTAAAVLLPLGSLIISRTPCSERGMAVTGSALSFMTACAAGMRSAREQKLNAFVCGLLCAGFLVLPLLLCGALIDRDAVSSDAVLSLVSMSTAGAVAGSVLLGGQRKRPRRRHTAPRPQGRKKGLR